ncbi:exosortase E/protease, VPEID-CTERM system [Tabrizicola sp.]|uniref:exosortase E/protease, VPEID-CTERM system n=1 Tax=Tabrizicola sp. TaxID=2005166 RepID=UPI0025D6DD4C|nr:exosortase E/protease, VPEID-CTERM system [Tabrizicola sp.]
MTAFQAGSSPAKPRRVVFIGLLFGFELVLIALSYQLYADIECGLTDFEGTCNALRGLLLRSLVVLGVLALLIRAWPATFAEFVATAASHRSAVALTAHVAGVCIILVPLWLYWGRNLADGLSEALSFFAVGMVLAGVGGLLWVAPPSAWWRLVWTRGRSLFPILMLAALLPDIVFQFHPLWNAQALASLTFEAVATTLNLLGAEADVSAVDYTIGIGDFYVNIGPPCSGVEGFALVTAFIGIYAFIFRADVRMSRFLLVMLPLGLLCSWILNILRITLLILIGARFSPEIAVNGFHSYAGWLMFTALAFGLTAVAQTMPWLHREGTRTALPRPLRSDPVAAQLLPFAAFMVAGTLVAALAPHPGLGMAFGVFVLAPALLVFLPVFRSMEWRPDLVSLGAGAVVGIGWVLTAPAADPELGRLLATFPAWAFMAWAVCRVLVTTVLVPVIEEMFFRGYLLTRLDGLQLWRRVLAVGLSSLAFALLHGRWVEAGLAGLIFALVALRRNRVADAIWAHVVANSTVAAVAAARGDWSLI